MGRPAYVIAVALLAVGALSWTGGAPLVGEAEARARRGPQQIAGTWEAAWRNSSGETRKGLIVVQQRGTQLSARIESHGNVTATGSIAGSTFTLRGTRLGIPFTITGRLKGKTMSGMLTAILVERHFTATRRKGK
jgi:Tfp pilus assembly protein FimT